MWNKTDQKLVMDQLRHNGTNLDDSMVKHIWTSGKESWTKICRHGLNTATRGTCTWHSRREKSGLWLTFHQERWWRKSSQITFLPWQCQQFLEQMLHFHIWYCTVKLLKMSIYSDYMIIYLCQSH